MLIARKHRMILVAATWACAPVAGAAPAEPAWPIRPYYDFVHWMAMGRPELALQQFAADAVVVAGPRCTREAPCIGRDAIRDLYLEALSQRRAVLPLKVRRFDGVTVHTQDGPLACVSFDGHAASWQPGHAVTLRGDRIVALRIEWTPAADRAACS